MNNNKTKGLETPTKQNYLIIYIDILGTKERLKKNDTDEVFKNIYMPFFLADVIMPKAESFDVKDIKIKIFSDNILFAYPIDNSDDKDEVFDVYERLSNFLTFFLSMFVSEGILFRGAITLGELYINDLMVWGEGLVTVVELEENVSIYPRIILGEDLLKIFDKFSLSGFQYEQKFNCMRDSDDCVFFNFFNYEDPQYMDSYLELAFKHINEEIISEQNDKNRVKVLQKYYWYRNFLHDVENTYLEIQRNKGLAEEKE